MALAERERRERERVAGRRRDPDRADVEVARVDHQFTRGAVARLEFEDDAALELPAVEVHDEVQVEVTRDEPVGLGIAVHVRPVAQIGLDRLRRRRRRDVLAPCRGGGATPRQHEDRQHEQPRPR